MRFYLEENLMDSLKIVISTYSSYLNKQDPLRTQNNNTYLKLTLVQLQHVCELLIKKELYKIEPLLIFEKDTGANIKIATLLKENQGKDLLEVIIDKNEKLIMTNISELITAYFQIFTEKKEYKGYIDSINSIRNKINHSGFFTDDIGPHLILINKCLSFVNEVMSLEDNTLTSEIDDLRHLGNEKAQGFWSNTGNKSISDFYNHINKIVERSNDNFKKLSAEINIINEDPYSESFPDLISIEDNNQEMIISTFFWAENGKLTIEVENAITGEEVIVGAVSLTNDIIYVIKNSQVPPLSTTAVDELEDSQSYFANKIREGEVLQLLKAAINLVYSDKARANTIIQCIK